MNTYIEISGVQIPEEKILEAGYVKKVEKEIAFKFYLDGRGDVLPWSRASSYNDHRVAIGNAFYTRDEVLQYREKQYAHVRVVKELRRLECGWELSWEDGNQPKFFPMYMHNDKELVANYWSLRQVGPTELVSNKEVWKAVIKTHRADVLKVMGIEE